MEEKVSFIVGSGNVFADLHLPNPEELLIKARLTSEIQQTIKERRLTLKQAATLLEMEKKELSYLLERGFSEPTIDQLVHYLRCLGREVELLATTRERQPDEAQKETAMAQ